MVSLPCGSDFRQKGSISSVFLSFDIGHSQVPFLLELYIHLLIFHGFTAGSKKFFPSSGAMIVLICKFNLFQIHLHNWIIVVFWFEFFIPSFAYVIDLDESRTIKRVLLDHL